MEDQSGDCPCKRLHVMVPHSDTEDRLETREKILENEITAVLPTWDSITGAEGDCSKGESAGNQWLERVIDPGVNYWEKSFISKFGQSDRVQHVVTSTSDAAGDRSKLEFYSGKTGDRSKLELESETTWDKSKIQLNENDSTGNRSKFKTKSYSFKDSSKLELESEYTGDRSKFGLESDSARGSSKLELESKNTGDRSKFELESDSARGSSKLELESEKTGDRSKFELESDSASGSSKLELESENTGDRSKFELESDSASGSSKLELKSENTGDRSKFELESDSARGSSKLEWESENTGDRSKFELESDSARGSSKLELESEYTGDISKFELESDSASGSSKLELKSENTGDRSKFELESDSARGSSKLELKSENTGDRSKFELESDSAKGSSKLELKSENTGDRSKFELESDSASGSSKLELKSENTGDRSKFELESDSASGSSKLELKSENTGDRSKFELESDSARGSSKLELESENTGDRSKFELESDSASGSSKLELESEYTGDRSKFELESDSASGSSKLELESEKTGDRSKFELESDSASGSSKLELESENTGDRSKFELESDSASGSSKLELESENTGGRSKFELESDCARDSSKLEVEIDSERDRSKFEMESKSAGGSSKRELDSSNCELVTNLPFGTSHESYSSHSTDGSVSSGRPDTRCRADIGADSDRLNTFFNISNPVAENTFIESCESEKESVKDIMSSFCSSEFFQKSSLSEISSGSKVERENLHPREISNQSNNTKQVTPLNRPELCTDTCVRSGTERKSQNLSIWSPLDHLTDSGFINMYSNSVMSPMINRPNIRPKADRQQTSIYSTGLHSSESNSPVLQEDKSAKMYSFQSGNLQVDNSSTETNLWPSFINVDNKSVPRISNVMTKQPNSPFILDSTYMFSQHCEQNINSLPSTVLVYTFRFISPCSLLRNVSCVCKYWYNVCRDPDLWREISLKNQCRLTNPILEQLVSFSDRVLKVNLTDCRFVSDTGVRTMLEKCLHLQSLKLIRCFDLTDRSFIGISENGLCPQLHFLHLDECCKITNKTILEVASACRFLKSLHVNQCSKVTDTGIISLAKQCSHLTQLLLDHCNKVTDLAIKAIVEGCPYLTYLNIMSCGVSDNGVKLLAKLSDLSNLDLSNIPCLTPDAVIYMSRHCKRLECINLSLNSVMNDKCVAELARNLPNLERLYCVSCSISDTGLEDIAQLRPNLVALDVGWCQDVTDHGVRVISYSCPHLDYFGLIRCDRVTVQTIEELVLKFPKVYFSTFVLELRHLLERARREGYQFGLTAK